MKLSLFIAFTALTALSRAQQDCPAPSAPEYTRYCQIDRYGDISLRELTLEEYTMQSAYDHVSLFAPNSLYPSRTGIFYDCECAPKCGVDAEDRFSNPIYKFGQVGLDDSYFSYFHDDTFHYCIAVPKRSLDSELYFLDNNGSTIPAFHCESTAYLAEGEDCYGWTKVPAGEGYRHHCYDTYCVDARWEEISPFYTRHTDEYWTQTYNGVVCSSSTYGQEICHDTGCEAVTPLTYVAPNLFSVSTTIHVSAHLGDVRVYSPAVVIAYETQHMTVFSEFQWGFDNNVDVVAQIYFSTRVQAPLFVSIADYSARNFNGSIDLFQFAISDLCFNRPGGYNLDVHELDEECKQEWLITMVPEFDDCMVDSVLDLTFRFDCDPAFVAQRGECPFTRGADTDLVQFEFDFVTDDWCNVLDIDILPPQASIDSYINSECAKADDFLVTERSHFEVSVEGNSYLTVTGTSLNGLHVLTDCGEDYYNAGWFVLDGEPTYMAHEINLEVVNVPARTCMYRGPEETVHFSFDLSSDFFHPAKKSSCQFEVWAIVEMEYLGFDEPTLLSVELTQDNTGFGDASPVNMGSIKMQGSYESGEAVVVEEESSAAGVSVVAATMLAAAIPALL